MVKLFKRSLAKKSDALLILIFSVVVIVMANMLSQFLHFRLDLTAEKKFSLLPPTKQLIKGLKDQVLIKIYLEGDMSADFKRLRQSVLDVVQEMRSTQLTEVMAESFSLSDKFKEFFVHNRTAGEFYDLVETAHEGKGSFETVHNSASRTLIAALTTNPERFIRWEAQGALIDTISATPYYQLIRIDVCCKFDTPEIIGDPDSPLGYKYNYKMMYNATHGGIMKVFSQNGRSAL